VRSYGQFCATAKALDVVGDRWTLLIIRELLVLGPSRFTELRRGLPGIATNLLTTRLRELEDAGLITREEAPPPIATALYRLTSRGAALEPVLLELLRWGMPLMIEPMGSEVFRAEWAIYVARLLLHDNCPEEPASAIAFEAGGERWHVVAGDGALTWGTGSVDGVETTVTGDPQQIMGLLSGVVGLDSALAAGVKVDGRMAALRRVLPSGHLTLTTGEDPASERAAAIAT
jgi:DNA-binding HxlR family transcriptional regulator